MSAVDEMEAALLTRAAYPGLARSGPRLVILDPAQTAGTPGYEDLALRLQAVAAPLVPTTLWGHTSLRDGGAFSHTPQALSALSEEAFAAAFAQRLAEVARLTGSVDAKDHVVVPQMDPALAVALVHHLSERPAAARPFVHLVARDTPAEMAKPPRFADLSRLGAAVGALNAERRNFYLYGWSPRLAARLAEVTGLPADTLEPPPRLDLAGEGPAKPRQFTVAQFQEEGEPEALRTILAQAKNVRGIWATRAPHTEAPGGMTLLGPLDRDGFGETIRAADAVLIDFSGGGERVSSLAEHAMATGALVLTGDRVRLEGTHPARVVTARDAPAMAGKVGALAADLVTVRAAAAEAKAEFWQRQRPARLVAQLLAAPLLPEG